ncbi:hypothetical protein [Solitalea lacus]|uniref:hypothetical protein n=1 Tax=Solitalea lacus TaxID=2911172 RepID=UPI001ED9D3C8|nr:hypothetical protein [Solitalea lacus]UKJ06679.1 hypothetical protein L2B55_14220 [Solitalea lacus]
MDNINSGPINNYMGAQWNMHLSTIIDKKLKKSLAHTDNQLYGTYNLPEAIARVSDMTLVKYKAAMTTAIKMRMVFLFHISLY